MYSAIGPKNFTEIHSIDNRIEIFRHKNILANQEDDRHI